ncbi:uncharacterized protein LOC128998618 isoform X1 [Macrosteles quadrilineatus]|uniref:uncharacterized protein LOC128998618 isoform X1 n=1 Tax=Macrosteles quadrilineatus TaxID=74068 RepID=UPI0023E14D01|nr:uncharacterized protein LOC128998618 isoform X1 [Macrosteles quadrilineatus]
MIDSRSVAPVTMLQPRRPPVPHWFGYFCVFVLVNLCCHHVHTGNAAEFPTNRIHNGERFRRNDGDVTVLSLEENAKSPRALGVLSSTARTFVQAGTTTEFTTQVLGTTLGTTYARLLSTGSRVFYDNSPRPKPTDTFLVFPTVLPKIPLDSTKAKSPAEREGQQTQSLDDVAKVQEIVGNHENYNKLTLDDLFDLSDTRQNVQKVLPPVAGDERENVVSVRKEYSVKRNSEIKPANVIKSNNDLPTFTVRHEFAPSGFSLDDPQEKKEDVAKPGKRNGKALFRGGIPVKQEKKLDTVTYFGFADFTTTVGDTVIVFMPKTPDPQLAGAVTSITGEATLRPEDAAMPVVTSIKTFMSHSPGMATKTVTGHSLSMHTTLPTIQADAALRESKAYEPVYVPQPPSENENRFGISPSFPSPDYNESIQPSIEDTSDDVKSQSVATEPLSTFATTSTQVYNPATDGLGLLKSIGGTESFNGTTTVFTSFVFGTVIDGAYKQLIQSASSVLINVGGDVITTTGVGLGIAPSSASAISKSLDNKDVVLASEIETTEGVTTEGSSSDTTQRDAQVMYPEETTSENELSNEVDTARKIDNRGPEQTIVQDEYNNQQSTPGYITRIVPSTVYKTFTYLTTFFIPDENGGQTTSIKSREVTSEDVMYVTKLIDPAVASTVSPTVAPSDITTESVITTTPEETTIVTEEAKTEGTTPQIPITSPDITTVPMVTTTEEETEGEDDKTTLSPTTPKVQEEEVDLIFKTLYTTYTYLTTFFQESSTSVSSREVVVTNVVTTTLDNAFAADPAIAGLFKKSQSTNVLSPSEIVDVVPTSVGIGRPTTKYFDDSDAIDDDHLFASTLESVDVIKELQSATPSLDSVNEINEDGYKTFYTTYTYFTTVFVDGETEVESRTEVYTNIVTPSGVISNIKPTSQVQLFSSDYVSVLPDEQVESPEDLPEANTVLSLKASPTRVYDKTILRPKVKDNEVAPVSESYYGQIGIQASNVDDAYKYDTTMSRGHPSNKDSTTNQEDDDQSDKELSKEEKLLLGISSPQDSDVLQTVVVDVTSSSSGGSRKVYRESYDDPDDQITSESNTEEIEPSFSPTILLQTSYTTFTYFTTVYKGTTSDVISRLDTVTNVVTETLGPSDIEESLSPEEATLPITYFTTFTYWTTLYKDGSTMVTSREETVSNIVTPAIEDMEKTESIKITPTTERKLVLPTVLTSIVGENSVDSTLEPKQLDSSGTETTTDPIVITPSPTTPGNFPDRISGDNNDEVKINYKENSTTSTLDLEPTTFYTTYTYFTTSYIGNSTVLNSRLETVTNIVTPTAEVPEGKDISSTDSDENKNNDTVNATQNSVGLNVKPTGLISTIRTSEVNNGITTLLSTDVFGTYIDGLYAQILESSTQIVSPTVSPSSTSVVTPETQPTGIVSINEGKIVDADGISTTFFTTKAIGTYVDKLYAQVVESTSSVQIDEERKTATPSLDPSTTVVGSKTYRTGLVRLVEGSIVKDKTTTFYESRVIGTLIDGRYAQIIESTSSFKVEMKPTQVPSISASSVSNVGAINPTATASTSPSPAVIESSIGDESDQDNEDNEHEYDDDSSKGRGKSRLSFSSRKKTFTPVIRPFASRPRPTFLPKKKTGDVGSATTITRNAFTPTITATPAVKSSERGFGSSRNRFSGGRRTSSSNVIQATASASSGRRFSGRRGSPTVSISQASSSQSNYRGRSSAKISPTATASFGSNSRRGSFNYRTSSAQRNSSPLVGSSRFRIRPTVSSGPGRPLQTVASTTEDIVNTNDIGGTTVVTEDSLFTVQDEEHETSPPVTTTESSRRSNNPLLRFRRPPILQPRSTTTTTPKPSTTPARRSNLLRRPDSRGATATTPVTPTRNRPVPTFPPRNRQRPSNSLFPPRGLLRKPTPAEEAEEKEDDKIDETDQNDAKLDEENDFADNDYEGSEHSESQHSNETTPISTTESTKTDRRGKALNTVQIRPFQGFRRSRTKRQAVEYGTRRYQSRYQRPTSRTPSVDYYVDDTEALVPETPTTRSPNRYTPRSRGQTAQTQPRVRPTKASSTASRAQFTLRDKSSSQSARTDFKRPTSRRRTSTSETTTVQRPKPPRLRTQTTSQQDTSYNSRNSGRRFTSRGRTSTRSRYRDNTDFDTYSFSPSSFDGTITVTHQVPTEVTIPVINGKVTEYKNVITAKPSLEILGPHQYTTATAKNGNIVIQLTSDITSTLPNGVMEVTKFVVYETPTTSITFTPTTLRGRKTSFSHIVPSTVYDVRQEVSTVQPDIAANAPLANLLLSQLLLGNLNLQPNPQQINPLLGLQNQQVVPPTPTTEFKTKTTTYVTTVTDHTSTVLPLTFRGKEILTTIVDSSTQVITATEYLTETVVVTPTAAIANNPQQINSLLLPALLQAQLLSPPQPTINPLLGTLQQQIVPQDILNIQEEKLQVDEPSQRFVSRRRPVEEDEKTSSMEVEVDEIVEQPKPEQKTRKKVKSKNSNKKLQESPPPVIQETSVITLYVSGRRPGDFSTILSTVTLGEESSVTLRKREAEYIVDDIENYKVESSKIPEIGSSFSIPEDNYLGYYVMSALNEVPVEESEVETQSLESIVGDVSKYLTTDQSKLRTEYIIAKPSKSSQDQSTEDSKASPSKIKKVTGHFLSKSPAETAPSQRKGNQFDWSKVTIKNTDDSIFLRHNKSVRIKRQVDGTNFDQPRRKRVKVRVPIQRRINIDEDLTPSEAQRSHDVTHQDILQTQDVLSSLSDFGTKKIKVIRKRPKNEEVDFIETSTEQAVPARRRVAVRRRRPVSSVEPENSYGSQSNFNDENIHSAAGTFNEDSYPLPLSDTYNQDGGKIYSTEKLPSIEPAIRRKKVLVTRRRPVPTPSLVEAATKRRVKVTKKRPVTKTEEPITPETPATIFSNFFLNLQTDYDYENPTLNTNFEQTIDDTNYNDEDDRTEEWQVNSELGLKDVTEEVDDDNEPRLQYNPNLSGQNHNSDIQESIVWFYEPTDSIIIDITPTVSNIPSNVATVSSVVKSELSFAEDYEYSQPVTEESREQSELESVKEENGHITGNSALNSAAEEINNKSIAPDITEYKVSEAPVQTQEHFEFENPPKFVRPTKSSVTRKPSRIITGYPGTRRRNPTTTISTTSTALLETRTSSLVQSEGQELSVSEFIPSEIKPTISQETLNTFSPIKSDGLFTSNLPIEQSMSDGLEEKVHTTPALVEPSLSEPMESVSPEISVTPTSYLTTIVTSTRLRTYTYVVTRVSGNESIITSSTSVKPATKTLTLTIPVLAYTDSATALDEGRAFQLATKKMSNGVEVIVAGDRTTMPGQDILRRLPSSLTRPITLAPSTLTDTMMMLLPQDSNQETQELVTKTYLTTYTYRTTLLEGGETVVSSREEVVSNVVTEERRPSVAVTPTPVTKVTLTASPSLATGVFHTTYTYLNTLVDGEIPLVLTSKRVVSNTVTAPEDLLQPSEPPGQDTNTYLNTVSFTKTLADGADFKIVSTEDVMTQVIITESDNKASSVEIKPTALTTDIVKTYFVTYTYFSTMLDGEDTIVHSEVATSSDVVTEKFVIPPKRTSTNPEGSENVKEKITSTRAPESVSTSESPINVLATKTYLTTFTYFTTLLQDNNGKPSTIVSSRTNVVQNIVTETLNTDLLDSEYLSSLRSSLQSDGLPIIATATLNDGQKMEITAFGEQSVKQTASPELSSSFEETSSNNNVITGSTIIFFDENDQIDNVTPTTTRTLMVDVAGHTKANQPTNAENHETTEPNTENLQSEFLSAAESQALTLTSGESEADESQQTYETSILASSTVTKNGATIMPGAQVIKFKDPNGNVSIIPVSDPVSKHPDGTQVSGTNSAVSNLLSLGSLGINSLNALGPVINAMAGLIKNNLKSEQRRRNDTLGVNANEPSDMQFKKNPLLTYAGPKPPPARSPIYIPVGGMAADSVAEESQNLEGHNVFPDTNQRNKLTVVVGRPTMESPLLAGGIPISPGQVITANSDVIIGRPAVHGPRPPVLDSKPYRKDDTPIGMKPPPPPKRKPNWPMRDHTGHYIPLAHHSSRDPPHRQSLPREPPYKNIKEHLQNYDTINFNPEFFKHPENFKKHPLANNNNNRPFNRNEFFIPPPRKEPSNVNYQQTNKPYYPPQQNIPVYNNIPNNNFDVRPTVHSDTETFNSINSQKDHVGPIQQAPILLPDNTDFVDQSSVNPLLVNIQPSQVANVIIPHGSSTALIYSGEHSQKGEIFNDPSPYPDAVVDHVVDALSTSRPAPEGEGITHEARVPINTNNLDVPVAPHGINVAAGNQQVFKPDQQNHQAHRHDQNERRPIPINTNNKIVNQDYYFTDVTNQGQDYAPGLGEYLKPPPLPPTHGRPSEDEYVFGEEPDDQDGGEVIQESNPRPLRPGQLPPELSSHPSTSMPIDPIDDDRKTNSEYYTNYKNRPDRLARPEGDINFSVVNSKPVQLDGLSSINNQAPIINGRPGVNQFTDKSQATLAVGSPTKLKPDGSPVFPQEEKGTINSNDRPASGNFLNPALFAAIGIGNHHEEKPMVVEPVYYENKKQPKPVRDNTVETMNLDEKLPLPPMFETPPPPQNPGKVESMIQGDIPRPFSSPSPSQSQFDRTSQQDDSVLGLSPPPPQHMYTVHEDTSPRPVLTLGNPLRRPILPQRKPKPPPPYKFEIPHLQPNQEPPRSTLPPKLEPPMLPETLSPPPPKTEEDYFLKAVQKRPTSNENTEPQQQWNPQSDSNTIIVPQQDSINPVLKGVLTVEEHSQQPEVITADSKVVLTNVINGHRLKPDGNIKITGSQPSLQTVVVGKPVPVPVTDMMPEIIIKPTAVETTNISADWKDGFVVGSETILDENHHFATPVKDDSRPSISKNKPSSVLVTTGVTTIFGNLFTRPTMTTKVIKPTKTSQSHHSVISVVVEPRENQTKSSGKVENVKENKDHHKIVLTVEGLEDELEESDGIVTAPPPSIFVVTHTQTTTVTATETTVVHSKGQEPSTHTLVVTKTQTSTLLDTVTEVHTLVKQTSILSTVTTTIPQATSTVYTGTVETEEYPKVYPKGDVEVVKHEPEDRHEDKPAHDPHDNESIFVVMTDKKSGMGDIHTVPIPDNRPPPEIQVPDEANEISPNVLLGNVFTHHSSDSECRPECKASRNELCQKIDNVMRCVCRPGFARMFPDRPCKPTYTYTMRLVLDRYGKNHIRYEGPLEDPTSGPYQRLVDATREGLDRMVMQSDLRDIYHGVEVRGFEPAREPDNAVVRFYVQLSDNTEETRLQDVLRKSLRSNNYSLGGTEVYAAKEQIQYLLAEDFDECTDTKFHDCSEDAQCFNLRGTYTCSCKEGFSDLSPNTQYPGRLCSAEQIGCERCNYHGTCYSRSDEEMVCECFQWYGGANCQINLKVLLLVLVTVGVCLVVLLVVCCVLACMKRREAPVRTSGGGFRRYRSQPGTGDKRAMISPMGDTSSETSVEATPPAYIKQATMSAQRQKVLRKAKGPAPAPLHVPMPVGSMEQRDRSLTVMIPRAKYRPAPSQPSNTLLTMSTFGPSEQKLLNYLSPDTPGRNTPDKQGSRNTSRKPSNSTTQSEQLRSRKSSSQPAAPRKPSTGALVSAGFEVSATVGRTKELDEAFLEPHTDLSQPQFNTIRTAESCIIVDIPPPPTLEAELEDIITKVDRLTVSEARSYDETTIHPPTKSLHRDYDSKRLSTSSHRNNDEGHTMVERDIGSTFMMPQTQLFKTDRQGSDISNFDSL